MIFDKHKAKTQRPNSGTAGASMETQDMRQQVPQVNDILAEIDKALDMSQSSRKKKDSCVC